MEIGIERVGVRIFRFVEESFFFYSLMHVIYIAIVCVGNKTCNICDFQAEAYKLVHSFIH